MREHLVASVPHSGTRTLQRWLESDRGIVTAGKNRLMKLHLTMDVDEINYNLGAGTRMYVPVRNPFDVADSWERRYRDASDKTQAEVHAGILHQLRIGAEYPNQVEYFKIEDLPVLAGKGPMPEDHPSREERVNSQRIRELREFILTTDFVQDFYSQYYDDDELWWL